MQGLGAMSLAGSSQHERVSLVVRASHLTPASRLFAQFSLEAPRESCAVLAESKHIKRLFVNFFIVRRKHDLTGLNCVSRARNLSAKLLKHHLIRRIEAQAFIARFSSIPCARIDRKASNDFVVTMAKIPACNGYPALLPKSM